MAMLYKTAEAKKYQKQFKQYVSSEIKKQNWNLPVNKTQHFYIDCDYYFDRIDKDSSNYDKCLLDAITETQKIWVDDNVALVRVQKVYYDKNNPRIELTIRPVDYIGIFNNVSHLENFKNKCVCCKRYRNGKCSILIKAIEGRIQQEIKNDICLKFENKRRNSK